MDALNLFLTLEKLFLIAKGLDDLLEDHYADLMNEPGRLHKRTVSTLVCGVAELRRDLETLAMADPLCLATDGLLRAFPVDNGGDSGYHKQE